MEPKEKMHYEPHNEAENSTPKVEVEKVNEPEESKNSDVSPENSQVNEKLKEKSNSAEPKEENNFETSVNAEAQTENESYDSEEKLPVSENTQDVDDEKSDDTKSEADDSENTAEIQEKSDAQSEVENKQSETQKDEAVADKPAESQPEIDYSKLSEVELINEFRDLLKTQNYLEMQGKVDLIKSNFYKKHKLKVQEEKKNFIDNGGFEEEFKPSADPYEQDLKHLLNDYKQLKFKFNKEIEAEKEENLKIKYQIIEDIKGLVNRKESINKTFQEFKELQQKWRDIGLVPQSSMKDMWENYHHHVENFYDYIKINKELRDLDLKKNMEEKIGLCEKAEELLLEPSILKAFSQLQKLHDTWREIGPVPRDKKEELWERFKDATTKINKKHQEFFENRKKMQKKNLEAKAALCDKVEEILALDLKTHKEWEAKSKEIIEIQKYWRTIGFAPKKENTSIYERFRKDCDDFFDKKREFYAKHKEIQANNLQLKIDLCVQAEALKESKDWKKTTEEYISIQKKWKDIGPVPRKHSDVVWKRFRTACDYFFEQKSNFFNTIDDTQVENLKLKNELIEEVTSFKTSKNEKEDFEKLKDFHRRWNEIGHVPYANKNDVQKRFRDAINKQFDKLRVDDKDRNLLKYKSKVEDLKNTNRGQNRVYAERDKFVSKLKQLENDLITLKNNIGFFANSKNAEALINDVQKKIANNEEQIEYLKEKIRIIDEADNGDE